MEYRVVEYERPAYFQLFIAYADTNYFFANFKYSEGYISITYQLKYSKYVKGLLIHMQTTYIHCGLPWTQLGFTDAAARCALAKHHSLSAMRVSIGNVQQSLS